MFVFDPRSDRYRNTETGRYVNRSEALAYVERSFDASRGVVNNYAASVVGGQISPSDWNTRMREEIKGEYIRQYLLGRGGRGSMTDEDFGSIGGMLADQYRYLDSFAAEVAAGNLSEAQIAARARMYVNSAREAYERGHYRAVSGTHDEVRWMLGDSEHCSDCEDLAAVGWQSMDALSTYPGAGATACLTNCKCSLDYR